VTPPPPPPDRRPRSVRVVVITDPAVPAGEAIARLAAVAAVVPAGAVLVQVRDKRADGAGLLAQVRGIRALGLPVWVNDRLDVALAARAEGVHLPEAGFGVAEARRTASITGYGIAIGCSRHSADAAEDVDASEQPALIQLGPVWATPGKGEPLGAGALGVRSRLSDRVHLVAVGGIDGPARAREAAAAGADAVAVIRAMWSAPTPEAAARAIAALIDAVSEYA
jgi:thiamine-phosphate pyrophosphorylase